MKTCYVVMILAIYVFKYFLLTYLYFDFDATKMNIRTISLPFDDIQFVCVVKIVFKILQEDKDLLATYMSLEFY